MHKHTNTTPYVCQEAMASEDTYGNGKQERQNVRFSATEHGYNWHALALDEDRCSLFLCIVAQNAQSVGRLIS
jgi:hypothetical protein